MSAVTTPQTSDQNNGTARKARTDTQAVFLPPAK
jgi:hypothetical protein